MAKDERVNLLSFTGSTPVSNSNSDSDLITAKYI
jgi:acyl-CoA reductase-like NAD-dependent aldehyde dehydrogenase